MIDSALRDGSSKVFAAHLAQLDSYEIAGLRLGKKTEALLEEAATVRKQLDRYGITRVLGPDPYYDTPGEALEAFHAAEGTSGQ